MRFLIKVQSVFFAVAIVVSAVTAPSSGRAAGSTQIHLKLVSQSQLHAMCIELFHPPGGKYVPLKAAVRAVENLPLVKRSTKHIPINESALAWVQSRDPGLVSSRNVKWVLVSIQGRHATKLFFVDARTGHLIDYMAVAEGCRQ